MQCAIKFMMSRTIAPDTTIRGASFFYPLSTTHYPLVFDLLPFPFRESATPEIPLSTPFSLDLTFHRANIDTEHSVVPGRPPTKLAAFSFFDISAIGKR